MTPTRTLHVANPADTPFVGIAVLAVDFRTRQVSPVTVFSPDGAVTASRIVDEIIGPVEADGKRRWRFALEFAVTVPAGATIACRATWGAAPEVPPWPEPPTRPRLPATEEETLR